MVFDFLKAKHRKDYMAIGLQYGVWPNRVWKLAHGSHAKNDKEKQIVHELLDLGLVQRNEHKHHREVKLPEEFTPVSSDEGGKTE